MDIHGAQRLVWDDKIKQFVRVEDQKPIPYFVGSVYDIPMRQPSEGFSNLMALLSVPQGVVSIYGGSLTEIISGPLAFPFQVSGEVRCGLEDRRPLRWFVHLRSGTSARVDDLQDRSGPLQRGVAVPVRRVAGGFVPSACAR